MRNIAIIGLVIAAVSYIVYGQLQQRPETVEIGQLAPAFAMQTLSGDTLTEQEIPSEGVVVNFWATYCEPCVKEIPLLEQAQQDGANIWAVNAGESQAKMERFLANMNITFPILRDEGNKVADQYEVMALPTTYFINGDGIVVKKITGELTVQQLQQSLALLQED